MIPFKALQGDGLTPRGVCMQQLAQMSFDPEVRAAAIYAVGRLIDTGLVNTAREDALAENAIRLDYETHILSFLVPRTLDGSPLVRTALSPPGFERSVFFLFHLTVATWFRKKCFLSFSLFWTADQGCNNSHPKQVLRPR